MNEKSSATQVYAGGSVPQPGERVRSYILYVEGKGLPRGQKMMENGKGQPPYTNTQPGGIRATVVKA